ncbi:hypothetical protein SUGI_0672730 [Cryptomeria japonica]|uniref:short-chain dehydrogenase reductase 2a-like n=1 Tax=Cryptomeria japonica TaxID=3369 RepID=UPI0024146C67|nr:short-chain dehydrogenase reductase 2a-like [Cryptomeria japonica]GLJ33431.1 hypothetical protein SUGI_0672730 [Cryptomeria japonica]
MATGMGVVAATVLGRLQGKVAIVTGGSKGIGEATVRLFSKHGAKVIIADVADDAGIKVTGSLPESATFIHCDVSKEKDVSAAVDFAMEKHGQLDIIYNNAGIVNTHKGNIADYDMTQFENVMNVNVKGVMHGIKHAARVMIPQKRGSIISTSSVLGILGGHNFSYTASKHAVVGLTKNGAAELGKYGIRVNCISPFGIATEMAMSVLQREVSEEEKNKVKASIEALFRGIANLKEATLKAEDIAEAALYLASEDSKYVSGHNLVVDGGVTIVDHQGLKLL